MTCVNKQLGGVCCGKTCFPEKEFRNRHSRNSKRRSPGGERVYLRFGSFVWRRDQGRLTKYPALMPGLQQKRATTFEITLLDRKSL